MIVQVNLVAVTVYFLILDETDTNDSIVAIKDQLTGKSLFGELILLVLDLNLPEIVDEPLLTPK